MRTYAIVVIHILVDELAQFPRSVILVRIKLLRLEATEPSLYHDVVGPPEEIKNVIDHGGVIYGRTDRLIEQSKKTNALASKKSSQKLIGNGK